MTRYVALPAAQRVADTRTGLGVAKGAKTGRFTVDLGKVIPDAAEAAAASGITLPRSTVNRPVLAPLATPSPVRVSATRCAAGSATYRVIGCAGAAAASAVLNVTVESASKVGYVTVFPEASPTPPTSNVNIHPGGVQANEVVSRLSQHRRVDVLVAGT